MSFEWFEWLGADAMSGPAGAEWRPVVHETALAGPEPRSVQAGVAAEPRISHRTVPNARQVADSATDAGVTLESQPDRRKLAGADEVRVRVNGATDGLS